MRAYLLPAIAIAVAVTLASGARADVKNAPYPEIKVTLSKSYKPDAAFEKMRAAFASAVAKKDVAALFALVGPTFVWTSDNEPAENFDMGRDALHNFKVVFGFRPYGKDVDGVVEDGPYWDALATFASDATFYQATDVGDLICAPMAAEIADDDVFEQARKKIETDDDGVDWYFTLSEVAVAKAPGDSGPPIAKLATVALPLLGTFPQTENATPSHLQVLLPSGNPGWIPAAAARPLVNNRLCYAKTVNGEWKIVAFDESE